MITREQACSKAEPRTVPVLVLDGFSLLSLGSIVEPFNILSLEFPESNITLKLTGLDRKFARPRGGGEIRCSEAMHSESVTPLRSNATAAFVVCSGPVICPAQAEKLKRVLRQIRRAGIPIYGIGGVVWFMAEAGLLGGGEEAAIHWKSLASFSEVFPDVGVNNTLFVKSSFGGTCAGELATLDLVMDLIGQISTGSVSAICNQLLISHVRCGNDRQPGSQAERQRHMPECLKRAMRIMAENIEICRPSKELAQLCGVSIRKLERLFAKHLGVSPMQYYATLKVERAHELLSQTDLSILEVALAAGFSNYGALSKRYKQAYGVTPHKSRELMQEQLR